VSTVTLLDHTAGRRSSPLRQDSFARPLPLLMPDGEPLQSFLDAIPREFARRHHLLAVGGSPSTSADRSSPTGGAALFTSGATPAAAILNTLAKLGADLPIRRADAELLVRRIELAYTQHAERVAHASPASGDAASAADTRQSLALLGSDEGDVADVDRALADAEADLLTTSGKAPIVRLVDTLLFDAIGRGASDLHVQPMGDRLLVRYRLDGNLTTVRTLPPRFLLPIVSRIKVLGGMDIAERRLPQDGRATVAIGAGSAKRSIDLRISSLPTSSGERVVVRILDQSRSQHLQSFSSLGMPEDVERAFKLECLRSNGLILVTGPTGSGKSTTLYTTLRWIAERRRDASPDAGASLNIMTIEDPIEFALDSPGVEISQSQVNNRKGVTFATGLRHVLRQDPDVIMLGEIRDAETARLAIQASLTGHLVFSTLHTNDAAGAATRLADLGVERYLVASSLNAVLAQRLVRLAHQDCSAKGCPDCLHTGFRGRIGIYELLVADEHLRSLVADAAPALRLNHAAAERGMRTLRLEGQRLLERGLTTRSEVARVTTLDADAGDVEL